MAERTLSARTPAPAAAETAAALPGHAAAAWPRQHPSAPGAGSGRAPSHVGSGLAAGNLHAGRRGAAPANGWRRPSARAPEPGNRDPPLGPAGPAAPRYGRPTGPAQSAPSEPPQQRRRAPPRRGPDSRTPSPAKHRIARERPLAVAIQSPSRCHPGWHAVAVRAMRAAAKKAARGHATRRQTARRRRRPRTGAKLIRAAFRATNTQT